MSAFATHAPSIGDVRKPERIPSHVVVAEQLRRQIALRLIRPGGTLPTQRELAVMFGVGRATADRAVRLLEADGLVVSRRGRAGGRFVTGGAGGGAGVDRLLEDVRARRHAIDQALVFRRAVEPAAAAEAAARAAAATVAGLRAAADAAEAAVDDADLARLDTAFHRAVAGAAGNALMAEAIDRVRLELTPALLVLPDSEAWRARTTREHRAIMRAIERGEVDAARRAMDRHLRGTEQGIRALLGAL